MVRNRFPSRKPRGFTMVELMIVAALMGVLAAIAIPYYQKLTARARRAELQGVLSKLRMYFVNQYEGNGQFTPPSGGTDSTWNPADPVTGVPAAGLPKAWNTTQADWKELPSTDGSVRMRYQYKVTNAGQTLQLLAQSNFPGIPGLYTYTETYNGANPIGPPTEFPPF